MRRLIYLAVTSLTACTSDIQLSPSTIVGTWNGTSLPPSMQMARVVFASDGTFNSGRVSSDGGYSAEVTGTYEVDAPHVTRDETYLDDEQTIHARFVTDAHLGSGGLCLDPLESSDAAGVVGTWTFTATQQALDVNGAPNGPVQNYVDSFQFNPDGSYAANENGALGAGTWQLTGDQLALMRSGATNPVITFTLLDHSVLCDLVFNK
jgi:hypothetical protein